MVFFGNGAYVRLTSRRLGWLALGSTGLVALSLPFLYTRWTQPAAPLAPASIPLKVIAFNAQFLPGPGGLFNKRPDPDYRARTLGRRLADYDVIGLSEVFDARARELLLGELRQRLGNRYHCVSPPPSERSVFGIGSGLVLVSRLPVIASHSLMYGNDSSVWTHGPLADGFAAKGALHARLAHEESGASGEFFDVFVTHLESYDPPAREAQYSMLADFIRKHSDTTRPALLLGDFNTDGRPAFLNDAASPYQRMVSALERGRPAATLTDLWPLFSPDAGGTNDPDTEGGGERIDYIFVSNPATAKRFLQPLAIHLNRLLDDKVASLSDHAAVVADLRWHP